MTRPGPDARGRNPGTAGDGSRRKPSGTLYPRLQAVCGVGPLPPGATFLENTSREEQINIHSLQGKALELEGLREKFDQERKLLTDDRRKKQQKAKGLQRHLREAHDETQNLLVGHRVQVASLMRTMP